MVSDKEALCMCSRFLNTAIPTLFSCTLAFASDWPQHRGPNSNGTVDGGPLLEQVDIGLSLAWKRPLGSGYSGIAVVGRSGATLYSDGEDDRLVVFDTKTGATLWELLLGGTYRGHHGSDDGPASTPALTDGMVLALSPHGRLVACRQDSGELLWERQIDPSSAPEYGFSASPLIEDDKLILQVAGERGRTITAFSVADGHEVWSTGDETTSYQNPTLVTLAGRRQIVTSDERSLVGLDPEDGRVLWRASHELDHDIDLAQPVPYGDRSFFIHSLDAVAAFELELSHDRWTINEPWGSTEFKRAYSVPVVRDGHAYGYSGRFLSAVDTRTGKAAWKSREPGAGHLILVGDKLAIATSDGRLALANATPDRYLEIASTQIFDSGGETPPTFAGGTLFVRNLREMAAVEVVQREHVTESTNEPTTPPALEIRGVLKALAEEVATAPRPDEVVDRFLKSQSSFPIIEPDGLVHFLYVGEAENVALKGSIVSFDPSSTADLPLARLPGTDLWFVSLERHPASHWEYLFDVDYGNERTDPLNPHTVGALFGKVSELRMPEWSVPAHIEPSDAPSGTFEILRFNSAIRGDERELRIYLPPDYGDSDARYPLLLVNNGLLALEEGLFDRTLDNLGDKIFVRPVAVFLPRSREELGGPAMEDYSRMLAEELVPFLEERFRLLPGSTNRAVIGVGSGGIAAAHTVTHWPETFGKLGMQSAYFPSAELGADVLDQSRRIGDHSLMAYIEWSHFDVQLERLGVDAIEQSRLVATTLEAHGSNVTPREVFGAPGWGSWRAQNDAILAALFPR